MRNNTELLTGFSSSGIFICTKSLVLTKYLNNFAKYLVLKWFL